MRFVIAFRAFFAVLFNRERAIEVQRLLALPAAPAGSTKNLPHVTDANSGQQSTTNQSSTSQGKVNQGARGADGTFVENVPGTSGTKTSESKSKLVPSATSSQSAANVSGRSDAITLLATLQREARFVDLVQESLDQYTDAQIGAAARDVLRDTKKCLNQMLAIEPLSSDGEGARVKLPSNPSPVQWKLVGGAKDSGTIVHAGWKATKVALPIWTGSTEDDKAVIAPVEVE